MCVCMCVKYYICMYTYTIIASICACVCVMRSLISHARKAVSNKQLQRAKDTHTLSSLFHHSVCRYLFFFCHIFIRPKCEKWQLTFAKLRYTLHYRHTHTHIHACIYISIFICGRVQLQIIWILLRNKQFLIN